MLSNARGLEIINGSVTAATFRGPPMIACAETYVNAPNEFRSAAWTAMQVLATILDAPAIFTDVLHDVGPAPILAALGNIQKFFTPASVGPWQACDGGPATTPPICGPLFFFDFNPSMSGQPDFTDTSTGAGLAAQIARASTNFRRNHLYGYAQDGVWTVTGESLDKFQRPPIHTLRDPEFLDPAWWTGELLNFWKSGRPASVGTVTPFDTVYRQGLTRLATQEGAHPGVSRHFLPSLVADETTGLLVLTHN